jgi:DNA-binding transcriptional ArsR family regulator
MTADRGAISSVEQVGKALSHPTKVAIIRSLRSGPAQSPTDYKRAHGGGSLGVISYHFRSLQKDGVLGEGRRQNNRAVQGSFDLSGPLTPSVVLALDAIDRNLEQVEDRDFDDRTPDHGSWIESATGDAEVAEVGKALSHPLRVALITNASVDGAVSPVAWSKANGIGLSAVAYHARSLLEAGVLRVSSEQQILGAIAHFYSLEEGNGMAAVRVIDALDARVIPNSKQQSNAD